VSSRGAVQGKQSRLRAGTSSMLLCGSLCDAHLDMLPVLEREHAQAHALHEQVCVPLCQRTCRKGRNKPGVRMRVNGVEFRMRLKVKRVGVRVEMVGVRMSIRVNRIRVKRVRAMWARMRIWVGMRISCSRAQDEDSLGSREGGLCWSCRAALQIGLAARASTHLFCRTGSPCAAAVHTFSCVCAPGRAGVGTMP